MARTSYDDLALYCLMCTKPVPPERLRFKAITCSPECATLRKNMIRSKHTNTSCHYCRRPSSNEERAAYKRFRKIEKKHPELLYPDEYQRWIAEAGAKVWPTDSKPFEPTPAKFMTWLTDRDVPVETGHNEALEGGNGH